MTPPPVTPPVTPPAPVGPFTIGGTVRAADVATVDSDTNDESQTGFKANDDPLTAQVITSPVTVVGSVNLVGAGAATGRNHGVGDAEDWFRLRLQAGQVVELLVGLDDQTGNDADLCVISSDAQQVGCSTGTRGRECVRAVGDGDYYVIVSEYSSASVYNLRVSAPGAGATCSNDVAPASAAVPGQLVAVHARAQAIAAADTKTALTAAQVAQAAARSPERRSQLQQLMRVHGAGVTASASPALGIDVVNLPSKLSDRRAGLAALIAQTAAVPAAAAQGVARAQAAGGSTAIAAKPGALRADAAHSAQDQAVLNVHLWKRHAKALMRTGAYSAVEPNWLMRNTGTLTGSFPPADERYASQRWHYEQISLPAAMQALQAMGTQPTRRPVVAVLDDGTLLDHPDLAPQLLSTGRAFASQFEVGDRDAASGGTLAVSSSDSLHGSHVAGTVLAATFDRGSGSFGAGVAPMAQLLPLRVFYGTHSASVDIAEAILYAAGLPNRSGTVPARRADVINMSLGGDPGVPCAAVFQDAITAARQAGVVVVAAAGNAARNDLGRVALTSAPANCSGVIAVSATDALRKIAPYSNSGDDIVVAAPGGDPNQRTNGSGTSDSVFSAWATFDAAGGHQASFRGLVGTSMASPHVAGVMALMRWVNPALTPDQIATLLRDGQLTDDIGEAGRDKQFGFGLINARKAVDAALASLGTPPTVRTPVVATPSTLDFGTTGTALTLRIAAAANSDERVQRITASHVAVSVTAGTVDANGLGEYTVRIDRSKLPAGAGSYFPTLTVDVTPTRSFTVQLAVSVMGTGQAAGGDIGPLYVVVYDPDADRYQLASTQHANGVYTWRMAGYTGKRVQVAAGTDLDGNQRLCTTAEVCGGYPVLSTDDVMTVTLTGNRTDLDFVVSPVVDASAFSVSGLASASAGSAGAATPARQTGLAKAMDRARAGSPAAGTR